MNQPTKLSNAEVSKLLNDLHVYQLELEMQNDELKASSQLLDEERAKFEGLYDLAPVGYYILNNLGIIEETNQNGTDLLKASKKGIIGRRFQSFISPQSWDHFYSFLHQMQNGDGKKSAEIQLQLQGDQLLYTRVEGIAIPSLIASNVKYYITIIDITVSRNAQNALSLTKDRLEMTLKASATGTWTADCDGERVYLDLHSLNILGVQQQDFLATRTACRALIVPADRARVHKHFLSASIAENEINVECRIISSNTVKHVAVKGNKMRLEGDQFALVGILMDITERKNLQEEAELMRNDQQKLIISATLNAQERERNDISRALHDSVCQILYGIKLNLQSLERANYNRGDFQNINELLDQAIKETRQLSYELTPSVLKDFGFVAGIKEMAQRTSTAQFYLDTYIDSSSDTLSTQVQLYIFRMIQELINNCIKHSEATRAEITVQVNSNRVSIRVSDNGVGMNLGIQEAIRKGSGLSGIKHKLFLLNGEIDFKNSKNGLCVNITFANINQTAHAAANSGNNLYV
jgi:PAS domain S-box-containing protein